MNDPTEMDNEEDGTETNKRIIMPRKSKSSVSCAYPESEFDNEEEDSKPRKKRAPRKKNNKHTPPYDANLEDMGR